MIKNLKTDKYFGHTSTIEELRNLIGIKKDKMPMLYEKHGAKKISLRTYLRIEHGEEKFKKERFQELANVFNKEFARRKINRVTDAGLLLNSFGEKHFKEIDRKSFTTLVPVTDSSQILNNLDRAQKKKVFGLSTLSPSTEHGVAEIFNCVKEFVNIKPGLDDESLTNFDNEKNLMVITTRLNSWIDDLRINHNLKLYTGIITIPTFGYAETWKSLMETSDPIKYDTFAKEVSYIIFYFSHNNEDELEFTYHNDFSLMELQDFLENEKEIEINREETLGVAELVVRNKVIAKMKKKIEELASLPKSFDRNKTSFNPIYIREPEWDEAFEPENEEAEMSKHEADAAATLDKEYEDESF